MWPQLTRVVAKCDIVIGSVGPVSCLDHLAGRCRPEGLTDARYQGRVPPQLTRWPTEIFVKNEVDFELAN